MNMRRLLLAALLVLTGGCGPEPEKMDAESRLLLQRGSDALASRDFRLALSLADSVLERHAGLADAHFLRGRVASEMERFDEAASSYRSALEHEPGYRGAWHNLGNNAYRRNAFRSAIGFYRREVERHPAPAPWQSMGRAYREIGLVDSALYAYRRALRVDSQHVRTYVDLTQLLDDEGDVERALAYAEAGHAIAPDNVEVRYMLGSLLVRVGQPDRALPHLESVAEEWPWHHGTFYNIGQALIRTGREQQAKTYLERAEVLRRLDAEIGLAEKAVRVAPNDPAVHVELGTLLRRAGRYDEAMHAYGIALQLDPGNPHLINNMSGLYALSGRSDEALRLLRGMLAAHPDHVEGWVNLGLAYMRVDSLEAAREAWQRALRVDPDNIPAASYLARLEGPDTRP